MVSGSGSSFLRFGGGGVSSFSDSEEEELVAWRRCRRGDGER